LKRSELGELRKDLTSLLDLVAEHALENEFPRHLMKFDPNLRREIGMSFRILNLCIEIQSQAQINDLNDEYSWEIQRVDIQLSKLKKLFVEPLKSYSAFVTDYPVHMLYLY